MVATHEASQTTEVEQFSHLFPAHLYIKKRNGGQEIDHNEDVSASEARDSQEASHLARQGLILFDHESKVQIGPETTASSYDRVPVDRFGT